MEADEIENIVEQRRMKEKERERASTIAFHEIPLNPSQASVNGCPCHPKMPDLH